MTNLNGDLDDVDVRAHKELLKDLQTLDKKKKRTTATHVVRSNPITIPQFNVKKLASKLKSILLDVPEKDFKPLEPPLEKPNAQRLKRAIGFEEVVEDVNQWESLVDQNRNAEHMSFPLDQSDIRMKENEVDWKPSMKTKLEKEVYALLTSSQPKPKDTKSKEEEAAQRAKALRELRLETVEVIRRRNLRLRLEKKMSLLNKSKSRKYRQILRRERMRKQKENFERLRTKDPQAALEILQEIEKERIKERLTLRHRNSKWVQTLQARSKHDPEARATLQENTEMRNELLRKVKDLQQEQEEALQEQEELIAKGVFGEENAWLSQLARASTSTPMDLEEEKNFSEMKHFWEEVTRRRKVEKEAQKVVEELEKRGEEEEGEDAKLKEVVSPSSMNSEEGAGCPQKATPIPSAKQSNGGYEGGADIQGEAPLNTASKKRKAKFQDGEVLPSWKGMRKGEENVEEHQETPPIKKKSEAMTRGDSTKKGKMKRSEAMTGSDSIKKFKMRKSEAMTESGSTQNSKKKKTEAITSSDSTQKGKKKKSESTGSDLPSKGQQEVSLPSQIVNGEKVGQPQEVTPSKVKKKKGRGFWVNHLLDEAFVDEAFDRAEKNVVEKVAMASLLDDDSPLDEKAPLPDKKDDFEFDLTIKDKEAQINECLPGEEPAPELNVAAPTLEILKEPSNPPPSGTSVINIRDGDVLKMNPRPMGQSAWEEITALSDNEDVDVDDSELVQLFEDDEENLKAFKAKKEKEEEDARVKDVDMFQDGWGSWTGPGIDPADDKKKQKYILEAPKQEKHRYNKLGNVIYREESDVHSNLRKLMVNQLPFPFIRVQDFEASVRQPIGRQFVPEDLHRKLIRPRVVTKMGTIIPPMDSGTLLKHQKSKKTTLEKKFDRELKRPVLIKRNKSKNIKKPKSTKIKKLVIK